MSSVFSALFSRDPAKDFPYEIGDVVDWRTVNAPLFSLHQAKEKGSGKEVSAFRADLKQLSADKVACAKTCLKRIRTLRHPDVLQYVDSLETDSSICIITELAVPLSVHLEKLRSFEHRNLVIAWGLMHVANALMFLGNDAKIVHCNVRLASVFVNRQEDWKLFGFEYSFGQSETPPALPTELTQFRPPEVASGTLKLHNNLRIIDSYGLGCLIWEIHNGPLPNAAALKSAKAVPVCWQRDMKRLTAQSPGERLSVADFLEQGRREGGNMKNKLVDAVTFLDEFQLKSQTEQQAMMCRFHELLDLFPGGMQVHKVLPTVAQALKFGNLGHTVLPTLLKIGKLLDVNAYNVHIIPSIVFLFSAPDRTTRIKLLQQVDKFADFLQPDVLNDKIFPHFLLGFTDTNVAIRECTIKAAVRLAPKLNYRNLNTELIRHLVKLLSKDEHPGIRTNATVAIGKIAGYVHPEGRQKVLLTAFCHATKDAFPPARVAAILALAATQQFYRLHDVARTILPALAMLMVDHEKQVRDQAFASAKGFVDKLEKASENPDIIPELEAEVTSGSGGGLLKANVPQWAGWALAALTSKFQKPIVVVQEGDPAKHDQAATPPTPKKEEEEQVDRVAPEPDQPTTRPQDGWDESYSWDDFEEQPEDGESAENALDHSWNVQEKQDDDMQFWSETPSPFSENSSNSRPSRSEENNALSRRGPMKLAARRLPT